MKKYEVWSEGYAATGQHGTAQRLTKEGQSTLWEGKTFKQACRRALDILGWDLSYYDSEKNTYWACRFYDNEKDARKSFG